MTDVAPHIANFVKSFETAWAKIEWPMATRGHECRNNKPKKGRFIRTYAERHAFGGTNGWVLRGYLVGQVQRRPKR